MTHTASTTNPSPAWLADVHAWAEEIRQQTDDTETFLDTLDGETDAMDVVDAILAYRAELTAFAGAMKAMKDKYAAREKALKDREAAARRQLGRIMDAMGEKTLRRPGGTLSMSKGTPELYVTDQLGELPDAFVKTKLEADRKKIRQALDAGLEVPGCSLGNAAPVLRIRS